MNDMINRRDFIVFGTALMATSRFNLFAAPTGPRRLRIGILSDIHVREHGWTYDPFAATLKWFDEQKVDGVILAGDLADSGLVEQLELVGEAWEHQFPGDRAADGRKVEKLFVTGNHDNHHFNNTYAKKKYPDDKVRFEHAIAKDTAAAWEKCFHEPYQPLSVKSVKGYDFVLRQYRTPTREIPDYLKSVAGRLKGAKPFFYVQHQHLKDTCYGPWAWGRDDGRSTTALSDFPNAVAFSGHSHYSLVDERCVWQGAFTSVGTSTLAIGSTPYGYENGDIDYSDKSEPVKEMPNIPCGKSKQGMIMDVFDDRIVLARYDLFGKDRPKLGPDWVLPLPYVAPGPYNFAKRELAYPVPAFPKKAKITVRTIEGTNRKKEKHSQVVLEFPAANAGKVRAFDYEVKMTVGGTVKATRLVLSPTYGRPPAEDQGLVSCHFAAADVPDGATFTVLPRNCYGRGGGMLSA